MGCSDRRASPNRHGPAWSFVPLPPDPTFARVPMDPSEPDVWITAAGTSRTVQSIKSAASITIT